MHIIISDCNNLLVSIVKFYFILFLFLSKDKINGIRNSIKIINFETFLLMYKFDVVKSYYSITSED